MNADVKFSGQAAQLGRPSVIQDISTRLVNQFAECIRAQLGNAPASAAHRQAQKPVSGFSLLVAAVSGALARLFHLRPGPREKGSP